MMRFDNVWFRTPEHDCEENKSLRWLKGGDSYYFCKVCFKYMGDAGRIQFSNFHLSTSNHDKRGKKKWMIGVTKEGIGGVLNIP